MHDSERSLLCSLELFGPLKAANAGKAGRTCTIIYMVPVANMRRGEERERMRLEKERKRREAEERVCCVSRTMTSWHNVLVNYDSDSDNKLY